MTDQVRKKLWVAPPMRPAEFLESIRHNGWTVDSVCVRIPGCQDTVLYSRRRNSKGKLVIDYRATLAAAWRASDAAGLPKWEDTISRRHIDTSCPV